MESLDQWIESAGRISWEKWETFRADFCSEIGIQMSETGRYVPIPPESLAFGNWLRLLPDDVVVRLQDSEDFNSEFRAIINETYNALEASVEGELKPAYVTDVDQDIDSKDGIRAGLCSIIIPQLRGDVKVNRLRQDMTEVPSEPLMDPPEYSGATITVERRNEHNMLDVAIFSIDDSASLFGSRYGNDTLMLEAMLEAGITPDEVIYDVAFETEGSSWVKSEPPSHSISYRTTDHKNRASFYKINDPGDIYGDAWGDIQEMVEIGNSDAGLEHQEFLHSTGSIRYQIPLGI